MIREPQRAAALLHPLRRRILHALSQPGSASSVARQLDLPRQKVNYHLRELEADRLLELVEERRKGNCTERILRAAASHYLIDPEVLGPLAADPEKLSDRFSSAYLVAVAAGAIRDLGRLRAGAEEADQRLATLTLQSEIAFSSPAARNAFAEELANELARLVAKHHDDSEPEARRFKLFLGVYPGLKEEDDGSEPQPEERD
ncbi:MAG: helix-turn-helix transcriptional regulator [Gemmatimonadetes bacterium]|uniref:Helix-turn-helix transcriptional regulator n=1 Tax=Candidatus Kutchimonas denitrificans TaxID=3056748 RepID=A0AAE4Z4F4_9BACT|nr:helix-turn-helix transcriptional regulator [Gemmatimonadota bacterium]NIR73565.1 helix-turn-helix transcriptional regulator [Candidatus Kutchimonas denitrificans]NIR99524.1 helix-turn-helix transcriptional regulator [Gemmatimonadota bacterium]NIT65144.1 helix-turn-helix transcriptional regulator [Gemmatimonadota bacterium]NIV23677.1 helix-turn-helix domain-containing protein [Gemmatimonadota bacterium]